MPQDVKFALSSYEREILAQGALTGTGAASCGQSRRCQPCSQHPAQAAWYWKQHGCAACASVESEKMDHLSQSLDAEAVRHWPHRTVGALRPASSAQTPGTGRSFQSEDRGREGRPGTVTGGGGGSGRLPALRGAEPGGNADEIASEVNSFTTSDSDGEARRARKRAALGEKYPYLMPRLGTDMIDRFTGRVLLNQRIMPILGRQFSEPLFGVWVVKKSRALS